ncbi:hypothetical protein Val02_37130 [Virgisporangium aliadipatigenens]|uniref:Copper type II ascorbate-dependent monooxygenase C-terminal domain-containing protein n=1 Tax=Virgisporangium aliadipatigenens TaxID=741659 RepID=A0A8J4DS12_9ACTN|nr:monooxygenase [Virgisporangium aliadipatigenens]GIJ46827.1 hypothetical protein Val02_37130 [Virgisporangium aliadipatigenens]
MRITRRFRTVATIGAIVLLAASACGRSDGKEPAQPAGHQGHEAGAIPAAAPLRAGERFVELSIARPYTPQAPAGATDEYRCFILDPGLRASAFLTGSQFLPQNADVVHHAILFQVPAEGVPEITRIDAESDGEGWRCFGDAGVDDAEWVGSWAPGANETLLDARVGHQVKAGGRIVIQIHYNTLALPKDGTASDRSGVRLRLSESPDLRPITTQRLVAPVELPCAADESGPLCDRAAAVEDVSKRFGPQAGSTVGRLAQRCAAGKPAAGSTQSCTYPVRGNVLVYASAGHMHLLGRKITVELNPGTPQARVLLDIPEYNFDDQSLRPLAAPVELRSGDTLTVTCTHDVALRKQLPQFKELPARYVVWGEGTSDEMCLGLLLTTPKA